VLARLGNVLYWTGCLIGALWIAVATFGVYHDLKTDDIREARLSGKSDHAILEEVRPRSSRFDIDGALKATYTPTEILNHLRSDVPEISRPHLRNPGPFEYLIVLGPALLVWLIGRAARYILAGR
jgi:hypothetical protein